MRYVFSRMIKMLRGSSQRNVPTAAERLRRGTFPEGSLEEGTTAVLMSCTRCPFRCGAVVFGRSIAWN
ncbi:hypothetical protein D3C72_2382260 [compost metagenome]